MNDGQSSMNLGAPASDYRRQPRPAGEGKAGLIDSLLLIGARIGANLLALVWTMLLVRLVQPELSGIAFRAIAMAQIGSILLTLNVESGAVRALVPAMQAGRTDDAAGFIRFNRRLIALLFPPLALAALVWHQLQPVAGGALLAVWIAVAAVMTAMARMTARHATALGVMRKGLLPRLLTGPMVLTCGLGLAAFAGFELRPWHVAALFALSEALTVVIQRRLLRAAFAPLVKRRGDSHGWRDWVSLGMWLSPGLLMTEYRKAMLIAAAGIALPPAQLSLFAVAFSIINIINFGVVAVDVAFSPRIAHAMAAGQPMRRDRLLAISAGIKLTGLGLGAALVAGLGHWALGLFGAEYLAAWPALMVMLTIPAAAVLFGPASVLLASRGQGRTDFTGNLTGAAVTVGAICVGGLAGGVAAAAMGAAAGYAVSQALMAIMCRRRLGIDPTLANIRHLLPGRRPEQAAA